MLMSYQLWKVLPMPTLLLLVCFTWCFPSFPPKKRMNFKFTYRKKHYRLVWHDTPHTRQKRDEVLHFLQHVPEFMQELFTPDQMDTIWARFEDFVKNDCVYPTRFHLQKRYQDTTIHLRRNSHKHEVWWQIAVERLFTQVDIRDRRLAPASVEAAVQAIQNPPDASELMQVTYFNTAYYLLRGGAAVESQNKLLTWLLAHPKYEQQRWSPHQFQRIWSLVQSIDSDDHETASVRVQARYKGKQLRKRYPLKPEVLDVVGNLPNSC